MRSIPTSATAAMLIVLSVCPYGRSQAARQPATASAPTTATAPMERMVQWHQEYRSAAEKAKRRNVLLLVVLFDPDAPAWEAFEEHSLGDISTRRFLAQFAAVRLNVTRAEGRKRLRDTGKKDTPVIGVLTPGGELLDSISGAIIPASRFRRRLAHSLDYRRATTTEPFGAAAQWKAVQARLNLSTREKAAPAVDRLLKLPAEKLPAGVTSAHLRLAKGRALARTNPKKAGKELQAARKLAPKDPHVAGEALIAMSDLALRARQYKKAHGYCRAYIRDFPKGPAVGEAYYYKALVEFTGLDDQAAAEKTLEEFISQYPDAPGVVKARGLLKSLQHPRGK